jgi:hypothetical protein
MSAAQGCEAAVLVVDAGDTGSWAAVREWAEGVDMERAGIRLCVVNKADRLHACHWLGQIQEWCLENMFEPIQVGKAVTVYIIRCNALHNPNLYALPISGFE